MTGKHQILPPVTKVYDLALPIVCKHFQADKNIIISRKRSNAQAAAARNALYYLLYFYSSASALEVAQICQRKDHSTILKSISATKEWISSAPVYNQALNTCRKELQTALQAGQLYEQA